MYFVYISNACTYSRDARRIRNVRATPTRDRDSGGKEEKYSLSFSPSSDIYIYIYYYTRVYRMYFVRACCPCRPRREAERKAREKIPGPRGIRPTGGRYTRAEDEDSLDRWPVSIVARNAKGERSRKTTEREEATLRTTLCNAVCCAR